jgi:hypothetical protein
MKGILAALAIGGLCAFPAFAEDSMGKDMSCTDYSAMDSTGQMAAMEHMETMAGAAGGEMNSTEDMMAKAAEACGAHPDMMVGEAMQMMMQ